MMVYLNDVQSSNTTVVRGDGNSSCDCTAQHTVRESSARIKVKHISIVARLSIKLHAVVTSSLDGGDPLESTSTDQ